MNTLIIGGSGYLGRYLADHLVDNGHRVFVSSRNIAKAQKLLGKRFTYVEWDGKTSGPLAAHLEDTDVVVNLSGENIAGGRWTGARKKRLFNSRVGTGEALTEAFRMTVNKPSALIQASATGIYGPAAGTPAGEKRGAGNGFLAGLCVRWEGSVKDVEEMNVRVVYLRTGPILGPHSPFLTNIVLPFRFGMGVVLGNGRQYLPWIHLRDEIRAIRFLLENKSAIGPFNLTSPEPVTMSQLVRTIGKIRRQPSWIHIPAFFLKLILGEMAGETILASQDILPEALHEAGFAFEFPDIQSALENLLKK